MKYAILIGVLLFSGAAAGQPGSIDSSFGRSFGDNKGILDTYYSGDDEATTVSITTDNQDILIGGFSDEILDDPGSQLLARGYDENGNPDKNIGAHGSLRSSLIHGTFLIRASAIGPNNATMILAGDNYNPADQTVDIGVLGTHQNFIGSSYAISYFDFGHGTNSCRSALFLPNNQLILAGYAFSEQNYDFAVAKMGEHGTLDSTFGTNGMVTTDLQVNQDYAFASALQTDGKIILAGTSYNDKQWQVALVRYNSDGSLDRSFGNTGVVLTAIHDSNDCANAVQVQKDGKIVVAGYTLENAHGFYHPLLVRFNPNGTVDSTFGKNGIVETAIGAGDAKANGMVIQSDGSIVIAGYSSNGKDDDFMIACYNNHGSLDNNFGNGGITTTDYGFGDDHANAIALQSDGSIVVAGYAFNGTDKDYAVARYLPDLSLGVIDHSASQTITTIYPNPIQRSAKVIYELEKPEFVTMTLYDETGKQCVVFINHAMRSDGINTEEIAIPNSLPPGSYYLRIEAGQKRTSVKIIKE